MSTAYEITGKIKVIGDTQTFASGFQKREIVVTTAEDKYPQDIKFDFVKDGCDRLEAFGIGDTVKIAFNVRGNEYNGKYYVSLQGWKIEGDGQRPPEGARSPEYGQRPASSPAPAPSRTATADALDEDEDDIPF